MRSGLVHSQDILEEKPDILEVTDKYTLSMIGPMIRINKFKQSAARCRSIFRAKEWTIISRRSYPAEKSPHGWHAG